MRASGQTSIIIKIGVFLVLAVLFFAPTVANALVDIKIMPLGDSITRGYWGSSNGDGYRRSLYLSLMATGFYNVDFVGSQTDGYYPDFDRNHEGHDGWQADAIRNNVYNWLVANPAEIVLLHIGTNDISFGSQDVNRVKGILDEIDRYSTDITVVLARIILRTDNLVPQTIAFNNAVEAMALARIAAGDKIVMVDMENALIYPNDMADVVHPNNGGYIKMADVWFNALTPMLADYNCVQVDVGNWVVPEDAVNPGEFIIIRNSTTGETTVHFELAGTAVYGPDGDYITVPDSDSITIPDGQDSATVSVIPVDNNAFENDKYITLTLTESADYSIGLPSSAIMFISDDEPKGDIYRDGCVDCFDLLFLTAYWLAEYPNAPGNIYRDEIVNFKDLAVFADGWLYCKPLIVTIVQPFNGSYFLGSTKYIDIIADAFSTAGSVEKVEFYARGQKIGEDSNGTDGWSFRWQNFKKGHDYKLIALGYDDAGNLMLSGEVYIVIGP